MPHDPLVTTDWLEAHLDDPDVRVVDIRGYVTTRPVEPGVEEATYRGAPEEYRAAHIPGAVFVDWTRDIVDPDDPVPAQIAPPERFAQAMASRGIGDATHVVAFDHVGGQFATRLWWALNYYGHDAVSVLDGGWNRWVEEGPAGRRPTSVDARRSRVHAPRPRPSGGATAEQVLARTGEPGLATDRRPGRRPVHRSPASRAAGRPHPGRPQPPSRAVLRPGGRVPAAWTRSAASRGARGSRPTGPSSPTATAASRPRSSCSTWPGWGSRG